MGQQWVVVWGDACGESRSGKQSGVSSVHSGREREGKVVQ